MPTNICLALGSKQIYVTEMARSEMEMFNVDTDGLPLLTPWGSGQASERAHS